jgi:hypothetical protein
MKRIPLPLFFSILILSQVLFAQAVRTPDQSSPGAYRSSDPVENISNDVARMTKAVEALSRSWGDFTKTFSTNQGLRLDERAQKLILAMEVLNRMEASLANLQKLKFDLTERQTRFNTQLATINDNLLPESIDRFVGLRGTTNAENLREMRRQALQKQQREIQTMLSGVIATLDTTLEDIRRTEQQVKFIRNQVFSEVSRQLSDL